MIFLTTIWPPSVELNNSYIHNHNIDLVRGCGNWCQYIRACWIRWACWIILVRIRWRPMSCVLLNCLLNHNLSYGLVGNSSTRAIIQYAVCSLIGRLLIIHEHVCCHRGAPENLAGVEELWEPILSYFPFERKAENIFVRVTLLYSPKSWSKIREPKASLDILQFHRMMCEAFMWMY